MFTTNVPELPGIAKAEVSAELEFPFTVLSFSFCPCTILEKLSKAALQFPFYSPVLARK